MKLVIWDGCTVIEELSFEGTTGPDVHIDPYNLPESISVRRRDNMGREISTIVEFPLNETKVCTSCRDRGWSWCGECEGWR